MTGRTVVPGDLEFGWLCEGCERPFEFGDVAYPQELGMIGEEFAELVWLCESCVSETNYLLPTP